MFVLLGQFMKNAGSQPCSLLPLLTCPFKEELAERNFPLFIFPQLPSCAFFPGSGVDIMKQFSVKHEKCMTSPL